jgi:hypothetical protein
MIGSSKFLAALAVAGATVSGTAQAGGNVYWSIGIDAPLGGGGSIGTVISNAPAYRAAPVYVQPAPVYLPPPIYVQPAPVVYAPPVYVAPRPVYVQSRPVYVQPRPVYVQPRPIYLRPAPVVYRGWVPPGQAKKQWRQRRDDRWGPVAYEDRRGRNRRD